MKRKFIARILVAALVMGTLSGCGNSSQGSAETTAQTEEAATEDIEAETGDTTNAEEEAVAKAAEEEARQEEADTYYEAGRECLYGLDGQEIDYEVAYTNFERALELGKTEANFYLGLLYDDWYNYPEQDYEKAKAYYEAAGDNPYAQLALGFLYYNGHGVEENAAKAQELFDAAIAADCVEGYSGTAIIAFDEEDYSTAFEEYNKVVVEGQEQVYITDAMEWIGFMYAYGMGVDQDYTKAMEWYEKAVDLGHARSMYNIGYMYGNGSGVEQDYAQAMEWYEKAADLGSYAAMNNIGYMYGNGWGVEQDYTKAMEWFEKSADLGNSVAMRNIGDMYEHGLGVEQDSAKAQEWYDKAEAAE